MRAVLGAALPVFALILTGAACGRSGMFDRQATGNLNRFAIYLALPALLFVAMSRITSDQAGQGGFALAFGGGIAAIFALGFILSRWRDGNAAAKGEISLCP